MNSFHIVSILYVLLVINGRYLYVDYFRAYTKWTWLFFSLLLIIPNSWHQDSFWFFHNTAWGLFLGIHGFYYLDSYNLLWEFAEKNTDNKLIIVSIDILVHFFQIPLVYLWWSHNHIAAKIYIPIGSGIVTGLMHILYCYFLTGTMDPIQLYRIRHRPWERIRNGWICVLLGHIFGEIILHQLNYLINEKRLIYYF